MVELLTIGYECLTPEAFLRRLTRCDVHRIIDVRELAVSRRRGFAKNALITLLSTAGIDYVHIPQLGCPREVRHRFREDRNWQRYTAKFQSYLDDRDCDLELLALLAVEMRSCLLCYEDDFNFCHRKFVAERVAKFVTQKLRINHLTGPMAGRAVDLPVPAAA